MTEWSKVHVWKACVRQRTEGSNPSLSASINLFTGKITMDKDLLYNPEEIYRRGVSPFQAVIMAAQEARFINEQARLRFLELNNKKATTVALERLRDDKITIVEE